MQNIRVIREEAEQEEQPATNPILEELSKITQTQSLLNELKSVELTTNMQSLTKLLQAHHSKFESDVKQISTKQLGIIRQLKALHIDPQLGRIDNESDRVLKKIDEFEQVRQETEKYKSLIEMMKQTLSGIEEEVDTMVDKRLAEISPIKRQSSSS